MNRIEQAKKLLESGNIQQGRQLLLDMATAEPENASVWLLLSGIATRKKDWELGVISFSHLVALRPSSGLASSGLVQSYMYLGRYEDVLDEIERFRSTADVGREEVQIVMEEHMGIVELIKTMR